MTNAQWSSSEKDGKPLQDECCDLYGEYCYPCNITSSEAVKEKKPQQRKNNKRNAD